MPPRKNKLSFPKETNTSTQTKLKTTPKFSVPMPPPPLPLPKVDAKGKGKATEGGASVVEDGIWADMYPPVIEQELAVHKKKVEIVRRWLTDAFEGVSLQKYRKLLILSGPAGAGKTATLRVLSKELHFEIIEWKNTLDDVYTDAEYDSLSQKFQAFMNRASGMTALSGSSKSSPRQVVLLEDLPNLLHGPTSQIFQAALTDHIDTSNSPIVLIVSDAGSRGEHRDEEGWTGRQPSVMDVRTIVPPGLLHGPYATRVEFNPIAKTLMKKGLQYTIDRHFGPTSNMRPPREIIDAVVESCEGDIRGALMALQFSLALPPAGSFGKRTKKGANTALLLITKREHSLALFHMLGKVLYNKRVGDPLSDSWSKKDQIHEAELDRLTPPPPPLPSHLAEFNRRASKVDSNALYADSPIDTSLYSLYLHQNYVQFCSDVEECDGVIESLSFIDSMGDAWDNRGQVAAEKFHALTLGTLVSLPSPVPRSNQKMYKPDYFEHLKKLQQGNDAVGDVKEWVSPNGNDWSLEDIKLWLPSVLKQSNANEKLQGIPLHHHFSSLPWVEAVAPTATVLEEDDDYSVPEPSQVQGGPKKEDIESVSIDNTEQDSKYWLEEDDIDDF